MGEDPSTWAGVEHEVALGPRVLERIADFFGSLLGERHPHADTYARHVVGGRTVVVVDAHDEAEVQRAHELLHDMQASDLRMVHRPEQPPLHEIVGAHVESPERVQAAMHGRSTEWAEPRTTAERVPAPGPMTSTRWACAMPTSRPRTAPTTTAKAWGARARTSDRKGPQGPARAAGRGGVGRDARGGARLAPQ
jgi:hypothetical protein